MLRRIFCVLIVTLFITLLPLSTSGYTGQRMVALPAGGFRFWELKPFEQTLGTQFERVVLTSLPERQQCVLYLDGQPLQLGQTLHRTQLTRVAMCTAKNSPPVSIGVFSYPSEAAPQKKFRIHCINPKF